VASTPIIDITSIDLDRVMISADEVGRLNPQCGPMRQLDHVIWHTDDGTEALAVKLVREDEFWVPYHIPGRPLMPGVLMIEAAAQLSSILYKIRTDNLRFVGFTRCDDVIFRGQVVPGDTLYLMTTTVSYNPRRLVTRSQGHVEDKLVFEATITGMVV
jgi:3-hydroxyacyl-[acyl-carrier-protein] dehydratase